MFYRVTVQREKVYFISAQSEEVAETEALRRAESHGDVAVVVDVEEADDDG